MLLYCSCKQSTPWKTYPKEAREPDPVSGLPTEEQREDDFSAQQGLCLSPGSPRPPEFTSESCGVELELMQRAVD